MSDQKTQFLETSKRLLYIACVSGVGIILISLVQWTSFMILLYPTITGAGAIVFGILADRKSKVTVPEVKISLYPLGNETKNFRLLFFSLIIQFLFIIIWGWDALKNPHLMDNYGMLYYLPIWLSFIFSWGGLVWRMPNITIFNTDYHKKHLPSKKNLYRVLLAIDCLLLFFGLVESLIIMYSVAYSGIWQIEIVLPGANHIFGSGFSYYFGWGHFLGIIIYFIARYRETRLVARKLKEQLKEKYPNQTESLLMLAEKLLDNFEQTKFF